MYVWSIFPQMGTELVANTCHWILFPLFTPQPYQFYFQIENENLYIQSKPNLFSSFIFYIERILEREEQSTFQNTVFSYIFREIILGVTEQFYNILKIFWRPAAGPPPPRPRRKISSQINCYNFLCASLGKILFKAFNLTGGGLRMGRKHVVKNLWNIFINPVFSHFSKCCASWLDITLPLNVQ